MVNFINEERKRKKLSVAKLGKMSGVNARTITSWIYCGVIPPVDKCTKVINALGYDVVIVKHEDKKEQ